MKQTLTVFLVVMAGLVFAKSPAFNFGKTASINALRVSAYPTSTNVPTGQSSAGTWTTNGAASLWQAVNEDADFGFSDGESMEQNDITASTPATLVFQLSSSGLITNVVADLRALSSGSTITVECSLSQDNISFTSIQTTAGYTATATNSATFPGLYYVSPANLYLKVDCSDNTFANLTITAMRLRIN